MSSPNKRTKTNTIPKKIKSPLSKLITKLKPTDMMKIIADDYAGNKIYRWTSPIKYETVERTRRALQQFKTKSPHSLTRIQVMGRIRGRQHELFHITTVPILPRTRLNILKNEMTEFFREDENKSNVYFHSVWTQRDGEFLVYAIRVRNDIKILILKDNQISEIDIIPGSIS